jgi:hypothetical protein
MRDPCTKIPDTDWNRLYLCNRSRAKEPNLLPAVYACQSTMAHFNASLLAKGARQITHASHKSLSSRSRTYCFLGLWSSRSSGMSSEDISRDAKNQGDFRCRPVAGHKPLFSCILVGPCGVLFSQTIFFCCSIYMPHHF